jgi:hypothetical protein
MKNMKALALVAFGLVALAGCSASDKDRAVEFALAACEERVFEEPVPPQSSSKFPSLATVEDLDGFVERFPDIAREFEDEILVQRQYISKRNEYEKVKTQIEAEKAEFVFNREKNARAAALLDDSYRVLVDPPSPEIFRIECSAIQEVYQE